MPVEIQQPEYKREDLYVSPFIGNKPLDRPSLDAKASADEAAMKKKQEDSKVSLAGFDKLVPIPVFKKIPDATITATINYATGEVEHLPNPAYEDYMKVHNGYSNLVATAYQTLASNDPLKELKIAEMANQWRKQVQPLIQNIETNTEAIDAYYKQRSEDKDSTRGSYRYFNRDKMARAYSARETPYFGNEAIGGNLDPMEHIQKLLAGGLPGEGGTTTRTYWSNGQWVTDKQTGVRGVDKEGKPILQYGGLEAVTPQRVADAVAGAYKASPELQQDVYSRNRAALYDLKAGWKDMIVEERKKTAKEYGFTLDKDNNLDEKDALDKLNSSSINALAEHFINTKATQGKFTDSVTGDPSMILKFRAAEEKAKKEKEAKMIRLGLTTADAGQSLAEMKTYKDVLNSGNSAAFNAVVEKDINNVLGNEQEFLSRTNSGGAGFVELTKVAKQVKGLPKLSVDYSLPKTQNPNDKSVGQTYLINTETGKEATPKEIESFRKGLLSHYREHPEDFVQYGTKVLTNLGNTALPKGMESDVKTHTPIKLTITAKDKDITSDLNKYARSIATSSATEAKSGRNFKDILAEDEVDLSNLIAEPIVSQFNGKHGVLYTDSKTQKTYEVYPHGDAQEGLKSKVRAVATATLKRDDIDDATKNAALLTLAGTDFQGLNTTNMNTPPVSLSKAMYDTKRDRDSGVLETKTLNGELGRNLKLYVYKGDKGLMGIITDSDGKYISVVPTPKSGDPNNAVNFIYQIDPVLNPSKYN